MKVKLNNWKFANFSFFYALLQVFESRLLHVLGLSLNYYITYCFFLTWDVTYKKANCILSKN